MNEEMFGNRTDVARFPDILLLKMAELQSGTLGAKDL